MHHPCFINHHLSAVSIWGSRLTNNYPSPWEYCTDRPKKHWWLSFLLKWFLIDDGEMKVSFKRTLLIAKKKGNELNGEEQTSLICRYYIPSSWPWTWIIAVEVKPKMDFLHCWISCEAAPSASAVLPGRCGQERLILAASLHVIIILLWHWTWTDIMFFTSTVFIHLKFSN